MLVHKIWSMGRNGLFGQIHIWKSMKNTPKIFPPAGHFFIYSAHFTLFFVKHVKTYSFLIEFYLSGLTFFSVPKICFRWKNFPTKVDEKKGGSWEGGGSWSKISWYSQRIVNVVISLQINPLVFIDFFGFSQGDLNSILW